MSATQPAAIVRRLRNHTCACVLGALGALGCGAGDDDATDHATTGGGGGSGGSGAQHPGSGGSSEGAGTAGLSGGSGSTGGAGGSAGQTSEPLSPCTKYVSPSGAAGEQKAFTTLKDSIATLAAGDTLCVAPGTYHEVVDVTTSGTESAPITIRALDPEEKPVLDGEYLLPSGAAGNYLEDGGGPAPCSEVNEDPNANQGPEPKQACFSWSNLVNIKASHIVWDSVDIKRSRGRGLVVGDNKAEGLAYSDIRVLRTEISQVRSAGLYIYHSSKVSFRQNELHDACDFATYSRSAKTVNWPGGIYDDDSEDIEFVNNNIYHVWGEALGLGLFHNTKNVRVTGNEIWDNYALNLYVQNVTGAVISENRIYHTGDPTYFRGGEPPNCIVFDSENGQETKDIVFANNIVAGCSTLIGFWQFSPDSQYANFELYNNTLLNPYPGGAALNGNMTTLDGFSFVNNIVYVPQGKIGSFQTVPNMHVHNNLWSIAPPSNLAGSGDISDGKPGLTNAAYPPPAGNFDPTIIKLEKTSPAIDHGATVSGVDADYFGNSRPAGAAFDIGAYELAK